MLELWEYVKSQFPDEQVAREAYRRLLFEEKWNALFLIVIKIFHLGELEIKELHVARNVQMLGIGYREKLEKKLEVKNIIKNAKNNM